MKFFTQFVELYRLRFHTTYKREEIKHLQNDKFRKLVTHAYHNSSYYHNAFESVGLNAQTILTSPIEMFPTITKMQLLEHFEEVITEDSISQEKMRQFDEDNSLECRSYKEQYHLVHSSGSTGKPAYFLYDHDAWNTMLIGIIRAALWNMSFFQLAKFFIMQPRVVYIAATDGRYGGAMAVGDGIEGLHIKQMQLNIQCPIVEWLDSIQQFKPNTVIGYPSAIKILGDLVVLGEVSLSIKRIITCGEPLTPGLRRFLEDTFLCDVVNVYGASESLAMGVEGTGDDGIYLFDDLNLIEVLEDGIYLTCLYNYTQPLIRYKMTDHLQIKQQCTSDIPFTKVNTILGRNEELLWFEDQIGNREFVHPLSVEGICVEGLLDYQFVKVDHNTFEVLIETEENADKAYIENELSRLMRCLLKQKQLWYVQFYIRFINHIKVDPRTGKKKLIVIEE